MKAVNAYRDTGHSTDPLGMYTGVTSDTPSASTLMRVDQATDNGKQFYRLHSPEKPYLEAHKREPRSGEMPCRMLTIYKPKLLKSLLKQYSCIHLL